MTIACGSLEAIAPILAGLSVAFGAFGAHALKEKLSDRSLEIFEAGARYQMHHALALLLVAVLMSRAETDQTLLPVTGSAFLVGIVLSCGSLYALSFTGIRILGAVAPLGGLAFIIGWGCLATPCGSLEEIAAWNYK